MNHTAKYILLETAVRNFLSQAELPSGAFLRIYHLAIRGMQELSLDVYGEPVTRLLPVTANKIIELPQDCMQWIKVGVPTNNGEVATLRHNKDLNLYGSSDEGVTPTGSASGVSEHDYRNYTAEDGLDYNLYGLPGGTTYHGEFREDEKQGILVLGADFSYPEVIVEYLQDPSQSTELRFPVQVNEAMIAFLFWQHIAMKPSSRRRNEAMVKGAKRDYYNQKRLARRRMNPLRKWIANDIIRLQNRISIRS
jgi:hypothetical protein